MREPCLSNVPGGLLDSLVLYKYRWRLTEYFADNKRRSKVKEKVRRCFQTHLHLPRLSSLIRTFQNDRVISLVQTAGRQRSWAIRHGCWSGDTPVPTKLHRMQQLQTESRWFAMPVLWLDEVWQHVSFSFSRRDRWGGQTWRTLGIFAAHVILSSFIFNATVQINPLSNIPTKPQHVSFFPVVSPTRSFLSSKDMLVCVRRRCSCSFLKATQLVECLSHQANSTRPYQPWLLLPCL